MSKLKALHFWKRGVVAISLSTILIVVLSWSKGQIIFDPIWLSMWYVIATIYAFVRKELIKEKIWFILLLQSVLVVITIMVTGLPPSKEELLTYWTWTLVFFVILPLIIKRK